MNQPVSPVPQGLYRPRDEKVIAGVCVGIARYFNIDVTLVRVLWAIFTIAGSPGFWAYLIMWMFMPNEEGERPATFFIAFFLFTSIPLLIYFLLLGH